MVTCQLQVERRTGKVRRPKTDVLYRCATRPTNISLSSIVTCSCFTSLVTCRCDINTTVKGKSMVSAGLEAPVLVSASVSKVWFRSRSWSRAFGLGLGLEGLVSFNIIGNGTDYIAALYPHWVKTRQWHRSIPCSLHCLIVKPF